MPLRCVGSLLTRRRLGAQIAALLFGSWRRSPPDLDFSAETLENIAPLLLKSGGAALGWWRIRNSNLRSSPAGLQLQQAYRFHAIETAVYQHRLRRTARLFRASGIEPFLGKGWAISRLYPQPGLRPYGDIDLYVQPEQYRATQSLLEGGGAVDLHRGFAELDDRSFADLYSRSHLARLDDEEFRIFSSEDHLRLLCLHLLRHGVYRPIGLCDIALALESRPRDFDWDYFLSGSNRRTDWAACTIGLAHQLLGAEVEDTPVAARAKSLPRWLIPAVLMQWGAGGIPHGTRLPMSSYLRDPHGMLRALRIRWPNGIEATVDLGGPFNGLPRLPFQVGDCLLRTARFIAHAPKALLRTSP